MLGHRPMVTEDYTGILRRRVWLLIVPAVVLSVAAYLVSMRIPNRYESVTSVLIEEQRISDSIVKPILNGDSSQKLTTMKERILSRTRLQPIVERFGLFSDKGLPLEERINMLHDAIKVTPTAAMEGTRANQLPGFSIQVTLNDPRLAQQVCSEILNMFEEEDIQSGAEEDTHIMDFLDKEVQEAQEKMNAQDAKLADFKRRNLGSLPDQESANLNLLTATNTQMEAVTQSLDREEQNKALMESTLSQQLSTWRATRQTGTTSPVTIDAELKQLQDDLAKLQEKFTDDWPDVKAKKQQIQELKKRMADAEAAAKLNPPAKEKDDSASTANVVEPENIQKLRSEIKVSDIAIQEKKRQQQTLQENYKLYQSRVQISPMVEQEYTELTRDNNSAKADYDLLLHKRNDSGMTVALQRRQEGGGFKPLDPASLPDRPAYPNRPLFAAAGFGGGLALGLALTLLLEIRDKSFRSESDIEALLKLPTLAMVPVLDSSSSLASRIVFRARGTDKALPAKT
jgi:polysaccharide chain length determinant protein (PEP-CTERM system associated)